jgi:glutathione-specific gamma-glutamylcyclotransferase
MDGSKIAPTPAFVLSSRRMTRTASSTHGITRESLRGGTLRAQIRSDDPTMRILTEAEHRRSVEAMLRARPDGRGDVWLFAYGSLIWNPIVEFTESRVVTVRGYHRRFCLWTELYRGSPGAPGLVLGLVPGGACRGVAYRIAASEAEAELELVWRREMITDAYRPLWLRTVSVGGRSWAIGFVSNRRYRRYAGILPEERVAQSIASARGYLGSCAAYLFDTVRHLEALGIADPPLRRLRGRVEELVENNNKTAM